jgi:hypothetical protein
VKSSSSRKKLSSTSTFSRSLKQKFNAVTLSYTFKIKNENSAEDLKLFREMIVMGFSSDKQKHAELSNRNLSLVG